jgi:cation:H+ antiporter
MLLQILLLILGFVLLIKGADWLVNGATALAKKHQVSDLAIGLTIVAFGTSMPELVVNAFAAFENHPDIVYGNVIGSNNFNLFMILGIAGLITPLVVQSSTVWKEIPFSLAAAFLLFFLANDFMADSGIGLSRLDGTMLLLFFAGFLFYVYKQLRTGNVPATTTTVIHYSNLKIWGFILLGLTLLVIGGRLVVESAVDIASALGVSQTLIGLTIVAAGTSLPELATSVVAAIKKNNDIAVGNIIGSNIFNIFFILGVSSLIRPIPFSPKFNQDIYLLIFGTVILFLTMFSGKKKKLDRWEAAILLAMYVGYTVYLINRG